MLLMGLIEHCLLNQRPFTGSQLESLGVSTSVHGPLESITGFPRAFFEPGGQNPHCFSELDVVGAPLPGWIAWCGSGIPHFFGGNLLGQDIPPDSCLSIGGLVPAHSVFLPFLPVLLWLYLISMIIKLVFSYTSDGSPS